VSYRRSMVTDILGIKSMMNSAAMLAASSSS
jgi:hypothetical protein